MNSKCAYKIIQSIAALLLVSWAINLHGKEAKIKISPYLNGITSIKDGYLELGPELKKNNLIIRPLLRLSLTDKKDSRVELDRNTASWSSVLAVELDTDKTQTSGPIKHFRLGFQMEWGSSKFTFFPEGKKENKESDWKKSFAFELKGMWYSTMGKAYAKQYAPQARIRYSRIWKKSDEIGIVIPSTSENPATVTDLIIEPPKTSPVLSLAVALPYFPGKGKFSYAPALYYQLTGEQNSNNPFGSSGRMGIEAWLYYYPPIKLTPNVRIGVAPYLSYRTYGKDKFDRLIYGGIVQLKFGTNFLKFF